MNFPKYNPTQTVSWKKLARHFQEIKSDNMNDWFTENPNRAEDFKIEWKDFYIDYSKNRITEKTLQLLMELAQEVKLQDAVEAQFAGQSINQTENRPVLHTALRAKEKSEEVRNTLEKMKTFSENIINGNRKGITNQPITDVVNIGIGGSDLGPKMVVDALQAYKNHLNVHFISNIDGDFNQQFADKLNPETTLFIIASKSFSTLETMHNAYYFKRWFQKKTNQKDLSKNFVAISSNLEKVEEFGIKQENIFPMWDWVGGRFSLWSAVGLSICCAVGFTPFNDLLKGAQEMDEHFKNTDFKENIPVILGLLSVWYNNFFNITSEAIIPYSQYLRQLVPHLQQAFMESNGKNVDRNGEPIAYQTGNIVWGAVGTNAQHAFFQLIHQGTKLVPCDFIGFKKPLQKDTSGHQKLMANFFAQTQALLQGRNEQKVLTELNGLPESEQKRLKNYKIFDGNKPTNTILISRLTPKNLGSLIALYEHKIFVQGVVWNIFSFDQWGVELGKTLCNSIMEQLQSKKEASNYLDASTTKLLQKFKN